MKTLCLLMECCSKKTIDNSYNIGAEVLWLLRFPPNKNVSEYTAQGYKDIELRTICDYAFEGCKNLTSVRADVTFVMNNVFSDCSKLTSVNLIGAWSIGTYAFANCTSLTEVYVPNISEGMFYGCTSLTSIPSGNGGIPDYAFYGCTSLTLNSERILYVDKIGNWAFARCTGLTDLTMFNARVIGDNAFRGCTGITNAIIPDNVETIGESAFCYCI